MLCREVLGQHDKTVAEVIIYLGGRSVAEGSSSYVPDHGMRKVTDGIPGVLHPPAEVNLFHVDEKRLVKAVTLVECGTPDDHTGA